MPAFVSPEALSTLIGSIYDCALDPSRWDQTLGEIREALECQNAALRLNDVRNHCFLISKTVGIEPYWQEQHAKYLAEIHARMSEGIRSLPSLDEPLILSRHYPPGVLETSPFIQQYLRPQGIVDNMVCFLMKTPTRLAGFCVARHERNGIVTNREVVLVRLLLPHVRRSVMISNVLDASTIERSRIAEAFNALRCAVLLIDARGKILHANRSADRMLRSGEQIKVVSGSLCARVPAAAAELRSAITIAAQDEVKIGKMGLAIRLSEAEMPPVFAHVLPLTGSHPRADLRREAVAAVFIGAPPDEADAAIIAAAAFGLTPSETRVLAGLLGGATLAETAARFDVAISTAKTHLDSIFLKTGVTRQADLMRLATRLASPVTSAT